MIGLMHFHYIIRTMLFFFMLAGVVTQIRADQPSKSSIDCSIANVDFTENPEWTQQEKLEAMNRAFYDSVLRYQLCQQSNLSSASSSSANAGAQASGDGDLSEGDSTQSGTNSVASTVMTGTETSTSPESVSTISDESTSQQTSDNTPITSSHSAGPNGKTPEDIPAADNDDVIAAQIRLAAEIEKDPDKKEKLWNEYRKYKGLPTR